MPNLVCAVNLFLKPKCADGFHEEPTADAEPEGTHEVVVVRLLLQALQQGVHPLQEIHIESHTFVGFPDL